MSTYVSDVSKSGTVFGPEIRERAAGLSCSLRTYPYAHELPEDLDHVRVAMGKFG